MSFGWTGRYVRIGTGLEVRLSSRIAVRLIGELATHGRTAGPHRAPVGVGFSLGSSVAVSLPFLPAKSEMKSGKMPGLRSEARESPILCRSSHRS
jgi:hypothetical protein